ncbi:hypothetical protein B0H11DRAFT_2215766 [Mycena galericulata]|nr:hypothetical protein B0H11DRAFT_2215752 [Mycena galericulata]KAJ7511028.1 hypothetical protein B0H11DRAFT_2215766 [Mycena galericulata]
MSKTSGRTATRGLQGSSLLNPWCMTPAGDLYLARSPLGNNTLVANAVAAPNSQSPEQELSIVEGPPSTIPKLIKKPKKPTRAIPAPLEHDSASAPVERRMISAVPASEGGPVRTTTSLRRAHEDSVAVSKVHAQSAPPVRSRNSKPGIDELGHRVSRAKPLTRADLYLSDARPPRLKDPKPHHICRICRTVKSHPVSYQCGHSHCYVCIRMWLEKHWTCPECVVTMTARPFRHEGEEESLDADYPCWDDRSRVSYSWDGLTFPTYPRVA